MGGYGRDMCVAAMMSGVSGATMQVNHGFRINVSRSLPADEYVPVALGVLYGLG